MLALKELYKSRPTLNCRLFQMFASSSIACTAAVALVALGEERYVIFAIPILLALFVLQAKLIRKGHVERGNEVLAFSLANMATSLILFYLFWCILWGVRIEVHVPDSCLSLG